MNIATMTKAQHRNKRLRTALDAGQTVSMDDLDRRHEAAVRGAVARGENVPDSVLADYPFLKRVNDTAKQAEASYAAGRVNAESLARTFGPLACFSAEKVEESKGYAAIAALASGPRLKRDDSAPTDVHTVAKEVDFSSGSGDDDFMDFVGRISDGPKPKPAPRASATDDDPDVALYRRIEDTCHALFGADAPVTNDQLDWGFIAAVASGELTV